MNPEKNMKSGRQIEPSVIVCCCSKKFHMQMDENTFFLLNPKVSDMGVSDKYKSKCLTQVMDINRRLGDF